MAKKGTPPPAPIRVCYHAAALAEIFEDLDAPTQADVIALVDQLDGKTHQELVALLDPRTERKVYQWEGSNARGGLRIVFAWGKASLWVIGAFVKHNDREGERLVQRILHRAAEVEKLAPC